MLKFLLANFLSIVLLFILLTPLTTLFEIVQFYLT